MRYEVRVNNNPPVFVEAIEFHNVSGGVVFFAERMRNNGTTDQWGNPVRGTQRVQVAFFSNVESVLEAPEEELGLPVVEDVALRPFHWFDDGVTTIAEPAALAGRAVGMTTRQETIRNLIPQPVDTDGINWVDAQRDE